MLEEMSLTKYVCITHVIWYHTAIHILSLFLMVWAEGEIIVPTIPGAFSETAWKPLPTMMSIFLTRRLFVYHTLTKFGDIYSTKLADIPFGWLRDFRWNNLNTKIS